MEEITCPKGHTGFDIKRLGEWVWFCYECNDQFFPEAN